MTAERGEKLAALRGAVTYRPVLGASIVGLSLFTALLEGVGVGFILPIVTFIQSSTPPSEADGLLRLFVRAYSFLGVPFTLEYLIFGVAGVMTVRFTTSFFIGWLRAAYNTGYQRDLRLRLFESIAYAPIEYIDEAGSDDLLNSLVTETNLSGTIVSGVLDIVGISLRGLIYLTIAAVLSPILTLVALVGLGASTLFVRYVLEPAYAVGDEAADINSRVQTLSQTGIQGMRDVRLFNLRTEMIERMRATLDRFVDTNVRLNRNGAALSNLNQLTNALVVFGLIYVGIRFTALSLGEIGVFLFAMFRLSPTVSQVNRGLYSLKGRLPNLVRVQSRIRTFDSAAEPDTGSGRSVPAVDEVAFEEVSFSYANGETVLQEVSFAIERGEHVAFVGQSGAGKSTIVSLLGRLQTPDSGRILADGTPIDELDVEQWRERLAVVRQNPYIFNETLWENLTIGNRDASRQAVERACEIAQVSEFLAELPKGYETELGDEGVRLSGGQKQRVAIARAILKDADVLVLDEATSELDSNIERDVHAGILGMETDYARISIAHRLSTVSDADRIYTLVGGSVAEVGTHEELLANDGMYANLYATQS